MPGVYSTRVDLKRPLVLNHHQLVTLLDAFGDRDDKHPLVAIRIDSYLARPDGTGTPVLVGDVPIYEDWGQTEDGNGAWLEADGEYNYGPTG